MRRPPRRSPVTVDDDRPALLPGAPAAPVPDAEDLAGPRPPTGRAILVTATVTIAPPVITAIAGGLGLAIVVGMLSIFLGLLGFSAFVYGSERWHRAPRPQLPRARARLRGR